MKKKFFIVVLLLLLALCCFGIYVFFEDDYRFQLEYQFYNYFPYENGKYIKVSLPAYNRVQYVGEEELFSILENGTGVIYFGYPSCPWCRNIVETLVDVTNRAEVSVYYVNVHRLKDSKRVISYLEDYLNRNEEGKLTLYVPDVYFVKDGQILTHHISAVSGYTDAFLGMTEEQQKELESIYQSGIDQMLGEENDGE